MSTAPRTDLVGALRAAGCVWAEDEAAVLVEASHDDDAALWRLADRRIAGEPLEQVVGWAAFCGLRVAVEPGVFVPRRRSEPLARAAVDAARERGPAPVVVDLCCGTGALALVVAHEVPDASVHAADVDPVAVRCAQGSLAPVGGRAYGGDLYDALPADLRGRVDVLVVNAPYVPTGRIATLPAEARVHEPRVSLDGGADGVDVHRRVAAGAAPWLAPGGVVLVETSAEQAAATVAALAAAGLDASAAPAGDEDSDDGPDVVIARGSRRPVR